MPHLKKALEMEECPLKITIVKNISDTKRFRPVRNLNEH
jgi:hypothetical protein